MRQKHLHLFYLKLERLRQPAPHHTGIDVTTDGTHGRHLLQIGDYLDTSHVARMPYFIAVGEMDGIAGVDGGMGVGKYSYTLHRGRQKSEA